MATDKPQSTYEEVLAGLGDALDQITVYGNEVLVATYMRPAVTSGGIILTDKSRSEDQWQGKVGIVLKKGKLAFKDNERLGVFFEGQDAFPGDKIVYRVSDGFPMEINEIRIRMLQDTEVRLGIGNLDPRIIY
jgi:co-chaperonin GroES (HSP10)